MDLQTSQDELFEKSLADIRSMLRSNDWQKSLKNFEAAFNRSFPLSDTRERGTACATLWALFTDIIAMSSMGFITSGIIEAQAILEEYSRRELVEAISTAEGRAVQTDLIGKESLQQLAKALGKLGALERDDVKFGAKLANARNALAHHNVESARDLMKLPKDTHPLDVWVAASQTNWIPLQIAAITYMTHLARWSVSRKKGPSAM